MMFFRFYTNSFLASLISILGYGLVYLGIMLVISEGAFAAIAVVPFGIWFIMKAADISAKKELKKQQKRLEQVAQMKRAA